VALDERKHTVLTVITLRAVKIWLTALAGKTSESNLHKCSTRHHYRVYHQATVLCVCVPIHRHT